MSEVPLMPVYLDIETSYAGYISVIGLYRPDTGLTQLVGCGVTQANLLRYLDGADLVCTYNGSRFDLPVISRWLQVDLQYRYHCRDLMYACWRHNLFGGLKRVEGQLGIPRETQGIDGRQAMKLWQRYRHQGDREALVLLLRYNGEDAVNLQLLERHLARLDEPDAPAPPLSPLRRIERVVFV